MNDNFQIVNVNGIDCYEENGTAYLKLETVARGLGFTQTAASGNDVVRWERVRKYLAELGVPTSGDGNLPDFIPENIFYRLAMKAKNEAAERFQAKIADEVIPTIRKTGGYVNNDELFINTYFDDVPEEMKQIFRTNLAALRHKNEIIAQQRKEIEHKEDVIVGLVEDIDLATKRQRINQIIRFHAKNTDALSKKCSLLYSEFEKKYHVNLSVRLENYKDEFKPKLKNKLDVIDRQMNMIPQLYEVCCKLFENDVKILVKEWETTIVC